MKIDFRFAAVLLYAASAYAQSEATSDAIRFRIQAGGRDQYKLAIPKPIGDGDGSKTVVDVASLDLALSGYFRVLDPAGFLANLAVEGVSINPQDWKNVGAEGVMKARATAYGDDIKYEFRLYEIAKGNQPVLSHDYRGPRAQTRMVVHEWCGEVLRYFTNEDNFFRSRIAFTAQSGNHRDVLAMDWDGSRSAQLTSNRSQNLLPAWSPGGGELAVTSFIGGKPDLYVMPAAGGKLKPISMRSGLNMGAAYSPDGSKIAVTLSQDGNSEIYLLTRAGQILKRLTNNPYIDTSPSWSPDGSRIAFVSDRHGSPQIWVMNADGSNQHLVTYKGKYNQTPVWCPRKDTPLIAFTARDEKLNYDIFTLNVETGEILRVTEGHGSNQHPSWAPNGRAIAYESSRGGIWISTADGHIERQVYRGSAASPTWGPQLPSALAK